MLNVAANDECCAVDVGRRSTNLYEPRDMRDIDISLSLHAKVADRLNRSD